MIINVRACSNRAGVIVSYLVENEERTGYASFSAKKFLIKNKVDTLAVIKKTLISSRKLPEITANSFVFAIDKVSRKLSCDTSLKQIVKTINDESMTSKMSTLSHVFFNNKPLPQVKAINIVNGNMYFMIKAGANYGLELIEREKIKCIVNIGSLVSLYRQIKQGTKKPLKKGFKKYSINANSDRVGMEYIYSTNIPTETNEEEEGIVISRESIREAIIAPRMSNVSGWGEAAPTLSRENITDIYRGSFNVTAPTPTVTPTEPPITEDMGRRVEERIARRRDEEATEEEESVSRTLTERLINILDEDTSMDSNETSSVIEEEEGGSAVGDYSNGEDEPDVYTAPTRVENDQNEEEIVLRPTNSVAREQRQLDERFIENTREQEDITEMQSRRINATRRRPFNSVGIRRATEEMSTNNRDSFVRHLRENQNSTYITSS